MASPSYKTSIKSNFSFKKLATHSKVLVEEGMSMVIKSAAKQTKENIESGLLRPLRKSTLAKRRKRGTDKLRKSHAEWKHKPIQTNDKTPLKYSGQLLESIKATKEGVEMEGYGKEHHDGFVNPQGNFIERIRFITGLDGLQEKFLEEETKKAGEKNTERILL